MKLVLQRVSKGAVTIEKKETRSIGEGLLVLVGICSSDTEEICSSMADKMLNLRIFDDTAGNMNLSLLDIDGECLAVSNFTLYAQCRKGRRPSFIEAASPEQAQPLYEYFVERVKAQIGAKVQTGEFGAYMDIAVHCNGPVTIVLDSDQLMLPHRS